MARADEENLALTLMANEQKGQLQQVKKENTDLRRQQNPLGMIGMAGAEALTGAVIGAAEGYATGGDATKEAAIKGVYPAVALAIGTVTAVAAGPGKVRAGGAAVASAGATVLTYTIGKEEGIAMKLSAMKAAGQAAAQPPAAQPGVQGVRR